MKYLYAILLSLSGFFSYSQNYPFAKDFKDGVITFKDLTQKGGQLKWFPHQNEKLKFRESENATTQSFSPEELYGFRVDTFQFRSLYNLEVYADNYALLGKASKIKHTFGQLIDSGQFNIYFVLITGYNAISGAIETYPNFLFEKKENNPARAAYPFAIRMKNKKYEKAKDDLYLLFKDYPEIVEKVKAYQQEDNFLEIVELIKTVNRK